MYGAVLILVAGIALAGCHNAAPTGQVVAKVGNDEITVQELQAEMAGFTTADPKTRKAAEQRALQNIIQRKLLAKAAVAAKIDRSPEFAIQKARAEDTLLVQAWEKKLVDGIPNPAPEQVRQYIQQRPEMFANHKIFDVDQVRMPPVNDPKLLADLKPLNTLEDVEHLLQARGITYETGKGSLDSLALGPAATGQISKLPPGEVFIVPMNNMLVANRITNTRITPVPDAAATKIAAQLVKRTQAQETLQRVFSSAIANHPKIKVTYNKSYAPPAPASTDSKKGATGAPAH
jgi:EpsD family peptidyl-prolyl cis-trans isomerase